MKNIIILALISNLSFAFDIDTFNKHRPLNHEAYLVWKDIKELNLNKTEEKQFVKDLSQLLDSSITDGRVLIERDYGVVEVMKGTP